MSNQQKDNPSSGSTGAGSMSRSDTTSPGGAVPVQGQTGKVGSDIAGRSGTDAAAGASMGGDGGQGLRRQEKDDTGGPRGDQLSNAVGAAAAGGTGLGEAASADDAPTGTSSGEGASLTGGDPSNGSIPPPTSKGGASSA